MSASLSHPELLLQAANFASHQSAEAKTGNLGVPLILRVQLVPDVVSTGIYRYVQYSTYFLAAGW